MAESPQSPKSVLQPLLEETQGEFLAQTSCSSRSASPEKKKDVNTQYLTSLGALVALLSISDGQPVSTWAGLSPSAIVSILAGTSRASLAFVISTCLSQGKWNWAGKFVEPLIDFDRFDAASRDAWGSIRLLRSMIRHPHWASVGAFTVIVLLAYEPFIQAVLAFKDVSVVLDNSKYNQLSAIELDSNRPSEAGPVIGKSSGLDAGYWNIDKNTGPQHTRRYGPYGILLERLLFFRDTAEPMARLFLRIRCIDLSEHAVRTSGNYTFAQRFSVPGGWQLQKNETLPEVSNKDLFANWGLLGKRTIAWTRHEIPELRLDLTNYDGKRKCGSGNVECPDTYLSVTFTTNPGRTINFRNSSTLVLAIQYLQADKSWRENETTWQHTQVTTQECGLYFCVNEYETSLEQGVLKERVVNSWTSKTADSHNPPGPGNLIEYRQHLNNTLDLACNMSTANTLRASAQ
ncbi:hypothetical protein MRS44_008654 [Fusarium solani]|uniref:uncharacterized protein n=1 Tax=Fusarium solani TaxID=169388 RepID=UPI0032C4A63D|nr:hypothetical protein MRS44_008654 [Fusarium solani]